MYLPLTLILFILLLFTIYYFKNIKENYITPFVPNESDANLPAANTELSAVNFQMFDGNFANFGKIGEIPAIPICNSCGLEFNCSVFPYDSSDNKETVCQRCDPTSIYKNYDLNGDNIYVYARSVGRPRQCRNIVAS